MAYFQQLELVLRTYLTLDEVQQVRLAYLEAEKAHEGQKRHSGEDYITHPVAVAKILAELHMDKETIMAALLHDVIEDTYIEKATLAKKFGSEVAELVDGATKLTQIKFESKAEAQAENFRKMLMAMAKDIRVIILKLADRLHNIRTLDKVPQHKRSRIAKETLEIYAPIAHRLGMHNFFLEFENTSFAALYPFRYRVLKDYIRKIRGNRKEIIHKVEKEVAEALKNNNIAYFHIFGREKPLYSVYKKMQNKHISFAEIMDVYAVRVIVNSIDACYRVLGVIHNLYKPLPGRFKDYIAIPKANSYQSLHTTLFGPYGLPIEVQIRTLEMNHVAETGIAAHWLYKNPEQNPKLIEFRAKEWLSNLMERHAKTKSPFEFIENVKTDLIPDDVYVFTPNGDILELPPRATAVDFAYAVHTDIGNTCIAAKINRRLMPLSTLLLNGQTVEIITAPGAKPNPNWLNFVATSRAKSKIKDFLKNQKFDEARILGKKLLNQHLGWFSKRLSEIPKAKLSELANHFNCKTRRSLYIKIGMGYLLPLVVVRKLLTEVLNQEPMRTELPSALIEPLLVKGSEGMVLHLATCCYPIPDDPIVGVFNPGKGMVIHSNQCQKIRKVLDNAERYIELQWEENIAADFKIQLTIDIVNEKGVLAKIAGYIASSDADINDIGVDTDEGRFTKMHLLVTVKNRIHLAKIIKRLRQIKEVIRITRSQC